MYILMQIRKAQIATLVLLCLFSNIARSQKQFTVLSPDQTITVQFSLKQGKAFYSISKGKEVVLEASKLGE
jgi:hypothetical protein